MLRGKQPIIRSDGQYMRDYFYIEDAAAAYILLAEKLTQNPELGGEAFNFSNETPVSVLELVERILQLMNSDLKPIIRNEATKEIRQQYLDAQKARNVLDWHPIFGLDEGLKRTIDWYKEFFSRE